MFSWLKRRKAGREAVRGAKQRRSQLLRLEQLEERLPLTTLPSGFSETLITSSGPNLNQPTAMEFSPTGQLWALEQTGAVKVVNLATGGTSTAHTLTVNSSGERGLLGIAFPSSYDGSGANPDFVYLYYTATTPNVHNRLSRFVVNNAGTASPTLGAETIIMEVAPEPQGDGSSNHNGGAIHFGPDGNLYIAIGDHNADGSSFQGANHVSQRLDFQHGKILRINVNGDDFPAADRNYAIPAGNPFVSSSAAWADETWALGLRNPFTFAFQPGTGRLFVNDVGEVTWEEINDGIAGSNFGWASEGTPDSDGGGPRRAFAEGFVAASQLPLYVDPPAVGTYSNPVMAYDHSNSPPTPAGFAITGGVFYPSGSQFGSAYAGMYFFADFIGNFIRVFNPATPGSTSTPDNSVAFASGLSTGASVDLKVDAAGNLYYLAGAGSANGEIYRISFTQPPPGVQIKDNGDTGFATAGEWTLFVGEGHQNDIHFNAAGTGADVASWTFTGLTPGRYRVSATWHTRPHHASNAPYTVLDGSISVGTSQVNQELAPNDLSEGGAVWEDLGGPYDIASGTLVVRLTDAANEYVIADAMRIERLGDILPPPAGVQIKDNGDTGFATTGEWTLYVGEGHQNDIHFNAAGTGADVASWTFTGLTPGRYRVSATWHTRPNHATNAPYTVLDGSVSVGASQVNQELAPNDLSEGGAVWEDLGGPYDIASGTLIVRLTDAANEYVIADAVRIERLGDILPPPAGVQIKDNGDTGFAATGEWTLFVGEGHQNDIHFNAAGTGADVASWTFTGLTPGRYRASATWHTRPHHATNAPFTVLDGNTPLGPPVLMNQELAPNDLIEAGVAWEHLGIFTISGNTLSVRLTDNANEYVIADAIRIERLN